MENTFQSCLKEHVVSTIIKGAVSHNNKLDGKKNVNMGILRLFTGHFLGMNEHP